MLRPPLTILHLFSGDLWAGAEVMIFNLLDKLKERSNLKIIALSLNEGILTDKLKAIGIETYTYPESNNSFFFILWKARRTFKGRKIDIIHSHRYKENILAFLLAKMMGVARLIGTIHGLSEPPLFDKNSINPVDLKTKMNYFILKNYFSRVVAVSQEMKESLIHNNQFKPEKVAVIHNGIEIPKLGKPAILPDHLTTKSYHIGTVGRMVPVKEFELFLQIASEIKREINHVRFSILGDGPLKENLKQKAKDLRIDDSVEFLTPRRDPFNYYQSIDIYLNTSQHEGIPLSILEAMASGKPVVAPKVGGVPEIIFHGTEGFLVTSRNSKEFVHFCLRLIQEEDLRVKLGENASRRVASCFNSSRMADSYQALYQIC